MADDVNIGLGMGEPENVPQVAMAAAEEQNVPAIELNVSVPDEVYSKSSEAWAIGKRGGVDVGSSDPTYHNNSKYYAQQAASAAETAAKAEIQALTVGATGLPAGSTPTATKSTVSGHEHIEFGLPQGEQGQPGADGEDAYVYVRYSATQPTQDSDMKTTPDEWMGIYSGSASTAPTTYTSYTWYKIKGETGSAANVYGNTIPMSSSDTTKVSEAIGTKLDADQGSTNAGKFMRVGSGGSVSYDLPTARYATASGFPASGDEKILYIAEDTGLIYIWSSTLSDYVMVGGSGSDENLAGEYDNTATYSEGDLCLYEDDLYRANQAISTAESWTAAHWTQTTVAAELLRRKLKQTAVADPSASGTAVEFISEITQNTEGVITPSKKTVRTMTGATASAAGATGLVPAPSAGDQSFYLKADGSWDNPPGSKLVVVDLDTVTNTSGSYTHTTQLSDVTADMKAIKIELSDPSAFGDVINISTADGSITLSCSDVAGTSTVKVSLMFVAGANTLTSSEFDVLAARIGSLSSLHTTDKSSLVSATNELCDHIVTMSTVSTTETEIGVFDGKKLYRKLFKYTSVSLPNGTAVKLTASPGISKNKVVNAIGCIRQENVATFTNGMYLQVFFNSDNELYIVQTMSGQLTQATVYAIIDYTE